ncbi:MAG: SMP-30/gluconolactonase/LRE family protein [Actinobacteria bacterium]|nr:SMP-30/gluconolactonase/LRE family protein [Actinomycetota bacterium]
MAKVAGADPPSAFSYGTNLEGAAFDAHGDLYFVDTTAPAGQPKILRLNVATKKLTDLYTDRTSAFTGLAFSPKGGIYLCDLGGGRVVRYHPASHSVSPVPVRGVGAIAPDDLAFDRAGDMYITDYQGTPNSPTGRVIRRAPNGSAGVLLNGLAEPNGIALTPDESALWLSEDLANRVDYVSLSAFGTGAAVLHVAQYLDIGAAAYADSITVDQEGNAYEAIWNAGEVLIYSPAGMVIGKVSLPKSAPWTTHVAIKPGTRQAYVTTAGPGGGYVYRFKALADGRPRPGTPAPKADSSTH